MAADVNPLDLQPGTMVDGWRVVRRIGRGGYAVVYEVDKDGQRFALKLACHTERSLDLRQVDARAEREVACLQQLRHPHIIRMRAHGRWPDPSTGFLYIILDFVDGDTLARWAERTSPTPHDFAVLFLKLFDATDHMHQHHVFHRDLSMNNIMVSRDGEPVIIDFGVADYATADHLTDGPLPPGTLRNRSPEAHRFWEENRHKPGAHYSFKATDDIFALGVNLYDLLTDPTPTRNLSRPPLGGEVMEPPSPWKVTEGRVPLDLSGYTMKLISPDLEVRYATAKDARRPLEEIVQLEDLEWRARPVHPARTQLPPERPEGAPVPAPPAKPAEGAAEPNRPGHKGLRPAPAGLALAALALAVTALLLPRPAPPPQHPPPSSVPAEKPTNRPERLPSPHPTQQEASPSVKPSDNSPTLTDSAPPAAHQKAPKRRGLSKAAKCALLISMATWHAAGCVGVQTRPPPEDCPEEAVRAMRELGWDLTDEDPDIRPLIYVDTTKGTLEQIWAGQRMTVYKDGPVTGMLLRHIGKAPENTLLDGHLWTTGDRIYGRYLRAHLPGGRTVPICLELRGPEEPGVAGAEKEEGSKPGHTVGQKLALARATARWH